MSTLIPLASVERRPVRGERRMAAARGPAALWQRGYPAPASETAAPQPRLRTALSALDSAISGVSCDRLACAGMAIRMRRWGWLPQHHAAVRAAEAGDECGRGRWPDFNVRAEGCERLRDRWGIGMFEVEGLEGQPVWR